MEPRRQRQTLQVPTYIHVHVMALHQNMATNGHQTTVARAHVVLQLVEVDDVVGARHPHLPAEVVDGLRMHDAGASEVAPDDSGEQAAWKSRYWSRQKQVRPVTSTDCSGVAHARVNKDAFRAFRETHSRGSAYGGCDAPAPHAGQRGHARVVPPAVTLNRRQ